MEYKTTRWTLAPDRKRIQFTDGHAIGLLKLQGTRDLSAFRKDQIKRVRIIRRADGYSVQFGVAVERRPEVSPSPATIGLDVGLESFYTDSTAQKGGQAPLSPEGREKAQETPAEGGSEEGSKNRRKTINRLACVHIAGRWHKSLSVSKALGCREKAHCSNPMGDHAK